VPASSNVLVGSFIDMADVADSHLGRARSDLAGR